MVVMSAAAFIVPVIVVMVFHIAVISILKCVVKFDSGFQHGHLVVSIAGVDEGKHVFDDAAITLKVLCLWIVLIETEQLVALFKAEFVILFYEFGFRSS